MLLNGFSIEVLVDERPLAEYTISDSATNILTTGKSYTLQGNSRRQTFSDFNNYIVAEPGKKFRLKFFSTKATLKNQLIAEVLVDGQFDKTYRGLKSRTSHIKDCFYNATRNKKFEFAFSDSIYDESSASNNNTPNSRGGIGAISIYFYKGRSVLRKSFNLSSSFDIEQVKVKENKKSFGIQCTTAFIPQTVRQGQFSGYCDMVKESNNPIAVLHLHYRPASWFVIRGIQIPNKKDDDIKLDSTIKNESNNNQQVDVLKVEENNRNNKRPFDEKDGIKEEVDVVDLTSDDAGSAGIKRARVLDWLSAIH